MSRGPFAVLLRHIHQLTGAKPAADDDCGKLLHRFVAERDEAAFAEIVRRNGAMVWRVCKRILGNEQDAEDAFQAAFLVLARKAGSLRNCAALGGWLHRVTVRIAVQARADATRRRLVEGRDVPRAMPDSAIDLERQESAAILHEELSQLPEKHRSPLVLCYLEGKTHQEAARKLGWPSGTMSRRVGRALELLRTRLTRRGIGLPAAALAVALADNTGTAAPAALVQSTARLSYLSLLGELAANGISTIAATLARDALAGMWMTQMKTAGVVLLVLGILGGGAGVLLQRGLAEKVTEAEQPPAAKHEEHTPAPAARVDLQGEPLPEGALFRFGSARWRHGAKITNSALSPDGKRLATVARFSVVVWDLETGKRLHEFRCDRGSQYAPPGITFSSDGTRLGHLRGPSCACVWDLTTGKEIWRHEEERRFTGSLCRFTPDGRQLILVGKEGMEYWDLGTKKVVRTGPVGSITLLSPDLSLYVRSFGLVKKLILGEMQSGKQLHEIEFTPEAEQHIAFSANGRSLAVVVADTEVQVRDIPDCKVRVAIPLPDNLKRTNTGRSRVYFRLGFTPDGRTLLMGTEGEEGRIRRWDLATKQELPALGKHVGPYLNARPPSFHCLPDGRTLISTGEDGLIRRWDLQTGQEVSPPDGYLGRTHAAYSSDGRFAAVGDQLGRLDLWDATSGKLLRTLRKEGTGVARLAFAPDGKTLAVAQGHATVQLYEVPSGKEGRTFPYDGGRQDFPFVYGLLFSPDGRFLYVVPFESAATYLWDVSTGEVRWRGQRSRSVAYSPDGAWLAVESNTDLRYVDTTTGKESDRFRFTLGDGLRPLVNAIAFDPNGRHLAVSLRGPIAILDARTGAELRRFSAVDNSRLDSFPPLSVSGYRVEALAFSPDGQWLVSGGNESVLRVWDVATAKEIMRLDGHESYVGSGVSTVAFSPDGRGVFTCGADGQAYLWSLRPTLPAGKTLEALWTDLASADAAVGYRAVWALSDTKGATDFLRGKLPLVEPVAKERLAKLIAELDGKTFPEREAATRALAELDELARPALEAALRAQPSAELRQRVQKLLDELNQTTTSLRRRAVQAMELSATAEARELLKTWAGGAAGARLTEDAKAALTRLAKRG